MLELEGLGEYNNSGALLGLDGADDELLGALRQRGWKFYTFIGGAARFMFAWDTDPARIDALCRDLKECAAQ